MTGWSHLKTGKVIDPNSFHVTLTATSASALHLGLQSEAQPPHCKDGSCSQQEHMEEALL